MAARGSAPCGGFTVPLAIPGIVSVGVFSFNHAWNEFLFALVFTSSERNKVLPLRAGHLDRPGQHLLLGHAARGRGDWSRFQWSFSTSWCSASSSSDSPKAAPRVSNLHATLITSEVMMKITKVTVIAVEIPLTRVFGGSRYNVASRCTVITRMETDTGLVSEVYNGDNRSHLREIVKIIRGRAGADGGRRGCLCGGARLAEDVQGGRSEIAIASW